MVVIAPCPAMLTPCDTANDVTPCTSVAPATASASGQSMSARCCPITVSIRYLELHGSTNPAPRLISMSPKPIVSDSRCSAISSRASAQARRASIFFFFFGVASAVVGRVARSA